MTFKLVSQKAPPELQSLDWLANRLFGACRGSESQRSNHVEPRAAAHQPLLVQLALARRPCPASSGVSHSSSAGMFDRA